MGPLADNQRLNNTSDNFYNKEISIESIEHTPNEAYQTNTPMEVNISQKTIGKDSKL